MRLFTAIAIPRRVLDNLARLLKELRPLAPVHWSPVENLHVTTKFIGEWPEERLPEIEDALENLNPPGAFDIALGKFGYFPNPHNPRAFFACVQAGAELATLAGSIDQALAPLGILKEPRGYSPHLTLARIKHENIGGLRQHIANMTNTDFGTFRATEFHLFLSETGPQGSVYTSLASYPLAAKL